jgi:hypothetical protein
MTKSYKFRFILFLERSRFRISCQRKTDTCQGDGDQQCLHGKPRSIGALPQTTVQLWGETTQTVCNVSSRHRFPATSRHVCLRASAQRE